MIPTIFPANYVDTLTYEGNYPTFPPHGTVDLIDCVECYAKQNEDDASEWELAITYPSDGYGFEYLELDAIILAKANDHQPPQAFRIYSIEKQIGKMVAVSCQHISYDMINVPVKPFKATSASDAIEKIRTNTIYGNNWKTHHFYLETDIVSTDNFEPDAPTSMRAMLLDGDDSIKGTYGGDLIFDNYHIQLKQVGGEDRDVTINYGVDLIDMTQEKNNSEMITGILPYYTRSRNDDEYETQPIIYGDVVYGPGTYVVQKIKPVDLSEHFPNEVPTPQQITAKGQEWVAEEEIGQPEITLTVSYATLGRDVRIHDAVRVRFPKMGIDVKSKVVTYKYNVLTERCEEIEVGHAKESQYFNLMDASKLRKGLIPPERIQNGSIDGDKIANGGVGSGKIGPRAVGGGNIGLGEINHELLSKKDPTTGEGGAVQTDNLGREVVTTEELGIGAVTSAILGMGSVLAEKIAPKAVEEGKIDDAAVAWAKLKSGSGQPVNKINALETDMAYVNRLFASTATINDVWAQHLHSSGASYFGEVQTNTITGYSSGRTFRQGTILDGEGNTVWVWKA